MIVGLLMLADLGDVSEGGLLSVRGGGWEFYQVPTIPWTIKGFVCGIAEFDEGERDTPVEVTVRYRQGGEFLWGGYRVRLEPTRRLLPFALPFETMLKSSSDFEVILEDDNGPVGLARCEIRITHQDTQQPQ